MQRARFGTLLFLFVTLASPRPAAAGAFELAGYAGIARPTYDETVTYDPGLAFSGIPGVTISQAGSFTLEGGSGLALGGSASFYFAGILGLEGRFDTADVNVVVTNPLFHVTADLPSPLPDISEDLRLAQGTVDIARLHPLSLNLKLRTPGSVRFTLSAGASYLPDFELSVTQPLALGVTGLSATDIDVGSLAYRAQASPSGQGEGSFGLNVGLGLQVPLGETVSFVVEARGFVFEKQTITWSRADNRPLSAIEQALADQLDDRLDPVEFNPTFIQATAGLAITF